MFDPVTVVREKFLHFTPWTCASEPDTYFDLLGFVEKEVEEIKNAVNKLTEKDIEDARIELLARHYVVKGLQDIKELEKIYENLFGKPPLIFAKTVQQRIAEIQKEVPTQPLAPKAEEHTEQEVEEAPEPNADWLAHVLIDLMDGLKQGDPKALQFKQELKNAITEIEDELNPTTVCEFIGSVFICEPCPRHRSKDDAMIIYPSKTKKKSLFFCLKDPETKYDDPYAIPNTSLADTQVLETYARLLWAPWRDYIRGEAEVIVRYYHSVYGDTGANKDTLQKLASIYQRIFGIKVPMTVLGVAIDRLTPSALTSGSAPSGSLPKIEPDPKTVVDTWDISVDNLYAKVVGLYKEKFTACYKVGYMLFCEPCPIHPDKEGDMLILDPLARVGIVYQPLWTCVFDPWTYYDRPNHSFPPMPENLLDAFDELQESYSKEDIARGRAELVARHFALAFPQELLSDRERAKRTLKQVYRALFKETPSQDTVELMAKRVFGDGHK